MSETLLGVLVGGAIGVLGSLATLLVEQHRWRREKRLDYLKLKRSQLELQFKEIHQGVLRGLESGRYSVDMVTTATYLVPERVAEGFQGFMAAPKQSHKQVEEELYKLSMVMKRELAEIDARIQDAA
jgi:hypothetical protein